LKSAPGAGRVEDELRVCGVGVRLLYCSPKGAPNLGSARVRVAMVVIWVDISFVAYAYGLWPKNLHKPALRSRVLPAPSGAELGHSQRLVVRDATRVQDLPRTEAIEASYEDP
jgi:hypothetical protein